MEKRKGQGKQKEKRDQKEIKEQRELEKENKVIGKTGENWKKFRR